MLIKRNEPNFPSHLDPNKGSQKWIQDYIKACWEDFKNIRSNSFYHGRDRYDNIRKKLLGKQSLEPYFKKLDINSANLDKQWLKVTQEPLRLAPKFRRSAISIVEKMIVKPKLTAIDPASMTEKEEFYLTNKARIWLKNKFEQEGLDPSLINEPEVDATTDEELEMFMEYSYKHRFSIEGQHALNVILNNNNFPEINLYNIEQLHDFGFAGVKDCIDQNGDIKLKEVDVSNFIVSRCKQKDFSDAIYMGEVYDLSIAQIKEMDYKKEISDAVYKEEIEKLTTGLNNKINYDSTQVVTVEDYESYRATVIEIEFVSFKSTSFKQTVNKYGNPKLKKKPKTTGEDLKTIDYKVIYCGIWVVGTNIFFGCELQTNMKRPKANINDVMYSRQCYAPELDGMETKSLGEDYVPIIDQTIFTWLKYQSAIILLQSENISVDISGLEGVELEGDDGKKWDIFDIIRFSRKTGITFYRGKDEDGKTISKSPINVEESAAANMVNILFNQLMNQLSLFQVISGFNDITDGSTPNERTAIGLAKLSVEATNNSLAYIGRAKRNIFKQMCHSVLMRVQDSADQKRIKGYINALGSSSIEFWELDPNVSARELGVEVEDAPSIEEQEELKGLIQLSLQGDQITIQDALMVKNIDDIKYAEVLLGYKVKKYAQMKQDIAMQNSQMQAQVQQQSTITAMETSKELERFKDELKAGADQRTFYYESELVKLKHSLMITERQVEVEGRVRGHEIQKAGKVEVADMQRTTNETKLGVESVLKASEIEKKSMEV